MDPKKILMKIKPPPILEPIAIHGYEKTGREKRRERRKKERRVNKNSPND